METHIKPLYHVNLTLSRKVGVYRCTFLMGECLAPDKLIRETVPTQSSHLVRGSDGVLRYYAGSAEVITRTAALWLRRNKEKNGK